MQPLLCCGLWAQVIYVGPQDAYGHVKDSITEYYYPGMYDSNRSYKPMIPTYNFEDVSELQTFCTPYDSIKYVVSIFMDYYYDGMKVKKSKSPYGEAGVATLELKDYTYPTINKRKTYYSYKRIKRARNTNKLKFVTYIRCDTPEYPKREVKRITTYVTYSPNAHGGIATEQWVDHLPYSTKAKYGGPCTAKDREKYMLKEQKRRDKEKAFYERMRILERSKRRPYSSKIMRKKDELEQKSVYTPAQVMQMKKDNKKRYRQRRKEQFRQYLQDLRAGKYDK